jgi:serine/threonine-protein kinase
VWVALAAVVLALGLGGAWALGVFGSPGIVVPTLTGLDEEQARVALEEAELQLGEVATENSDDVEVGLIIRQDPAAGARVEKGTAINIVISVGVAQTEVPDLTRMTESDAIEFLRDPELGLDYDKTVRENNSEVPKGEVIRTEPAAGQTVPVGTRVVLYVSEGVAQVKVPDVTGKPRADAEADLKAAGLSVKVNEVFNDTVAKGSVISQRPDGGVLVEVGSTVTIDVSKGPEVILVPDVRNKTEAEARAAITAAGLTPKVVYVESPDDGIVINQFPIPGASAKRGDTVEIEVGKLPEGEP